MLNTSEVSTRDTPPGRRASLVRAAAFDLFNLEVSLGSTAPDVVNADIHIARGQHCSLVGVETSASVVCRTPRRARAAASDNMMVYLIREGGSWFENTRGQVFHTVAGSVVVGSQDVAYQAGMPAGRSWRFQALSVPERLLPGSAHRIRQGGFQAVPAQAPLHRLLSSYLGLFFTEFTQLDSPARLAALGALDPLLAAGLGDAPAQEASLPHTVATERWRMAVRYIEANLESPALTPAAIARHLCISPRQLHRAFEATGRSVSAEVLRLRLARARHLVHTFPHMAITHIALGCGFSSQATFYRAFKAAYGATASDLRHAGQPPRG